MKATESRHSEGFTLMEVMLAAAILTLGLVGILALFPVAIRAGRQVVEDSNAVVIAQSVAEAIRDGIRNRKRDVRSGSSVHSYFVFQHDGVQDPVPARLSLENPRHDYYILLPRFPDNRSYRSRQDALGVNQPPGSRRAARVFVYPETDRPANGGGDAFRADNDGHDDLADDDGPYDRDKDNFTLRVDRTYGLGNALPSQQDDSRDPAVLEDQQIDALHQYSYAFAIHASYFDADLREGREYMPANRLYHVKVLIFRGSDVGAEDESGKHRVLDPPYKEVIPGDDRLVYELDFEVSP